MQVSQFAGLDPSPLDEVDDLLSADTNGPTTAPGPRYGWVDSAASSPLSMRPCRVCNWMPSSFAATGAPIQASSVALVTAQNRRTAGRDLAVLSVDNKGIMMRPDSLRSATENAVSRPRFASN